MCAHSLDHAAGRYLATAAADRQLIVWDVAGPEPEVLTKHTLPAAVAALEWHPHANELAGTLLNNNVLSWQGVVPTHMVEPHVSVPDAFSLPGVRFLQFLAETSQAALGFHTASLPQSFLLRDILSISVLARSSAHCASHC